MMDRLAREERSGNLVLAAAAGLAAAIAGAVVWGLIVKWTEYEVGIVAWGIGFLVAMAVVFASGNRRGLPLQVLAVALALAGVLLGKYLAFVWSVNAEASRAGMDLRLPLLAGETVELFTDGESGVWGWFDLLWIGLAAFTAFRIPQADERESATAPETSSGSS